MGLTIHYKLKLPTRTTPDEVRQGIGVASGERVRTGLLDAGAARVAGAGLFRGNAEAVFRLRA